MGVAKLLRVSMVRLRIRIRVTVYSVRIDIAVIYLSMIDVAAITIGGGICFYTACRV